MSTYTLAARDKGEYNCLCEIQLTYSLLQAHVNHKIGVERRSDCHFARNDRISHVPFERRYKIQEKRLMNHNNNQLLFKASVVVPVNRSGEWLLHT